MPFWSSYFRGSDRDAVYVVRFGPGRLVTIVGQSTSVDLPVTAGCLQPANAGGNDVFVARVDPYAPPATQLQWCTYLGGSDLDLVLDAEVDPSTGVTTIVGVTRSTDFPGIPSPVLRGPSDGFVAQLDAAGATLISSMCVGGSGDDRVCEVEIDGASLEVTIAGVTESNDLPATAGTIGPTPRGLTDAFVARVDPVGRAHRWATYIGGSNTEGMSFANFVFPTTWEPNLDRMALAIDDAGRPVLATVSFNAGVGNAPTTGNAVQPAHGGASDVYLVVLDLTGTPLLPTAFAYASFLGGSLEDRPHAIARHPDGGWVVAGYSFSNNFPCTPGCLDPTFAGGTSGLAVDGFVSHVDPARFNAPLSRGLQYSTYFGGSVGEDALMAVAVDQCGHVSIAGYTPGYAPIDAPTATTPRCLQDTYGVQQFVGTVARIRPEGRGAADLLYSSYVGGTGPRTLFVSIAIDDLGDVIVGGETHSPSYPQQQPLNCPASGGREGAITYLPLFAGGVFRDLLGLATAACAAPLQTGSGGAPVPGATFTITACDAPPNTASFLVLGGPLTSPTPLPSPFSGWQLVDFVAVQLVFTDGNGCASVDLQVPAGALPVPNWGLGAQWFALTTPACPGSGMLANSERLNF